MEKYLNLEGLEYLCGKIKEDLESKQEQLTGQPGQLAGFGEEGIQALTITAGDNIKLNQTGGELKIGVSMDSGTIEGELSLLDDLKSPGTYTWLDNDGMLGNTGGLWNVVVSKSAYSGNIPSVTQALFGTYALRTKGRVLTRAFYYANNPQWTPWRELVSLDQISNINLLDNPLFQINQRNIKSAEYTGSIIRTADRWEAWRYDIEVTSDGISIAEHTDEESGWFRQMLDIPLMGKDVTFSALIDGELYSVTVLSYKSSVYSEWKDNVRLSLTYNEGTGLYAFNIYNNTSTPKVVQAVKLEIGTVQTLAHQDAGGAWVLSDPPPDPALELAKCQRYQFVIMAEQSNPYPTVGMGIARSATEMNLMIALPITMRTTPSVSVVGSGIYVRNSMSAGKTLHNIMLDTFNGNTLLCKSTLEDGNFDVSGAYQAFLASPGAAVIIDANL